MELKALMLLIVCAVCVFEAYAEEEKVKKLQIGVKKRPEKCDRKSKTGDTLHMDYTVRTENFQRTGLIQCGPKLKRKK